jgi:AraC-like DNA-binding protein
MSDSCPLFTATAITRPSRDTRGCSYASGGTLSRTVWPSLSPSSRSNFVAPLVAGPGRYTSVPVSDTATCDSLVGCPGVERRTPRITGTAAPVTARRPTSKGAAYIVPAIAYNRWPVGKNLASDAPWTSSCRVPSASDCATICAQLAPEFVVQAPQPQTVLVDQLGALLALTASELSGGRVVTTPVERSVRDRVHDHITQRCPDTSLHASDVANSLSMSTRTLHRALAACGETFGAMLIQARVDLAVRMLESPLFDRVTTAEIGRRAGFSDASHFVKVLRRHTGHTPLRVRRTRRG